VKYRSYTDLLGNKLVEGGKLYFSQQAFAQIFKNDVNGFSSTSNIRFMPNPRVNFCVMFTDDFLMSSLLFASPHVVKAPSPPNSWRGG
jgi:hypothetical protein